MTTRPNFELMHEVLDQIRLHPETHDQGSWRSDDDDDECGTTMCFAGWTVELGGRTWVSRDDQRLVAAMYHLSSVDREYLQDSVYAVGFDGADRYVVGDLVVTHCADAAQRLLRIDDGWATVLFFDSYDLDELELAVKSLENTWNVRGE